MTLSSCQTSSFVKLNKYQKALGYIQAAETPKVCEYERKQQKKTILKQIKATLTHVYDK